MMSSQVGMAHGASLPLYSLLLQLEGTPAWEAVEEVRAGLTSLKLVAHIEAVVVLCGGSKVELEACSDFGHLVLKELASRMEFPPCPEGDCEYDARRTCKWCGHVPSLQ